MCSPHQLLRLLRKRVSLDPEPLLRAHVEQLALVTRRSVSGHCRLELARDPLELRLIILEIEVTRLVELQVEPPSPPRSLAYLHLVEDALGRAICLERLARSALKPKQDAEVIVERGGVEGFRLEARARGAQRPPLRHIARGGSVESPRQERARQRRKRVLCALPHTRTPRGSSRDRARILERGSPESEGAKRRARSTNHSRCRARSRSSSPDAASSSAANSRMVSSIQYRGSSSSPDA